MFIDFGGAGVVHVCGMILFSLNVQSINNNNYTVQVGWEVLCYQFFIRLRQIAAGSFLNIVESVATRFAKTDVLAFIIEADQTRH